MTIGSGTTLDTLTEADVVGLGGPDAVRDVRLAAFKHYSDAAWPDSRLDEYWRSTPFSRRFRVDLDLVDADDTGAPQAPPAPVLGDDVAATIVDGVVTIDLPDHLADAGVVVASLDDPAHAGLVAARLTRLTSGDPDGTGADVDRTVLVNDAGWTGGVLVHVPRDVEVEAAIGVHVHVATPGAHLPRVVVDLDHHARATVVVEHTSLDPGEQRVTVSEVVEAFLGPASSLDLVCVQDWTGRVDHMALHKGRVDRDAKFRPFEVIFGGGTVRLRPEADLVGPGAETYPAGLYAADDGQWFDLQPYIRHLTPRATSDVLVKGSLQGRSRTVFRGNVYVAKHAVGTVTDETNRTLILTDEARADATPFLEIECADIIAGHGSATGQVDARALFYLEARGIPRETAIRLIVTGFFRELLERTDLAALEEYVTTRVEREVARMDLSSLGLTEVALDEEA